MKAKPRVSVVVPLFRSKRFVSNITANVLMMPDDVQVIISDRHLHDDAAEELSDIFATDPRVTVLRATDGLDWVRHANLLLHQARGEYWRYLPHDDVAPEGSLEALVEALDGSPGAILSYGRIEGLDTSGTQTPDQHRREPPDAADGSSNTLDIAIDLFWHKHYWGAFKGLVRRDVAVSAGVDIRATPNLQWSDRTWLFALRLLGSFVFVPRTILIKRGTEGSAASGWDMAPATLEGVTATMGAYTDELLANRRERDYVKAGLARQLARELTQLQSKNGASVVASGACAGQFRHNAAMTSWSLEAGTPSLQAYLASGWSFDASEGGGDPAVWTIAQEASLVLPTPPSGDRDVRMELTVSPFVGNDVTHQDVWVFFGDLFCAFGRITSHGVVSGLLPRQALEGPTFTMRMNLPDACRPVDLGLSADERLLGVRFIRMQLTWD